MTVFAHLFQPLVIRGKTIKNRILSTGHDTNLPTASIPNDALVAYHAARAQGGAGLIVVQVAGIHETARYTAHLLMATSDDCIPGYRRIAAACHSHGTLVFGQLFHPGREIMDSQDGSAPVAYAPSAVPNERFHVMPRPLSIAMIEEIIAGYAAAALRLQKSGLDGVEIVASHGYLPAQFLNPKVNQRQDHYGGTLENRLRFLRAIIAAIRQAAGPEMIVGLRISSDEKDPHGLTKDEILDCVAALEDEVDLDYFSVVAGTSASIGGAIHIAPPMALPHSYTASEATDIKARTKKPIFVAGRINQPQEAERILARGGADMIGMTRALICDPDMPQKAAAQKLDDIRACIGCNQACIGHFHLGYPISCIQHPETGRETGLGRRAPLSRRKRVLVAGGGPAGMKAAAIAAARGHDVTLCESGGRLGGQALLAQMLPGRAEFGGIVTNLAREMELAGVNLRMKTPVTADLVAKMAPDALIIATGAEPRPAEIDGAESGAVIDAWQAICDVRPVGRSVVIADWRCDWIGLGLAEKYASAGCRVRLVCNGTMAGQRIHQYVRDHWVGRLHKLGVEIIPYARLYGIDGTTAYFQHVASGEPVVLEETDTLIASLGHRSVTVLEESMAGFAGERHVIGDCCAPRTAEEAVLEGLKAGNAL